ncbi:MAG: hypothetical protein ACUVTX_09025 [Bacteroidales bacterium]
MFDETLFSYGDLELRLSDFASEDILYLLNHTVLGSEGGMRYSLRNINSRIEAYRDKIRFVSLYKKNQLVGSIGTCFRISGQGPLRSYCSYVRYLAFQSSYQSDLRAGKMKRVQTRTEKEDSFKQKTLDLFSKPHLLNLQDVGENDRHIMYAFVESMNERSKNLVHQAGYEYVRSFLTVAFSRFSPVRYPDVYLLTEEEKPLMNRLLTEYYRNYSLFTSEYAFFNSKYYVLKEDGEIIAGVCAIPGAYKIYFIPGIWGWVIMNILPRVPYYRRIFSPDDFNFLVFDAIYCKKGEEKKLARLFESVCAIEGYNTGLTWADDRSELYEKLNNEVDMGALNRMLNARPGHLYIRFVNFGEKEKDSFFEAPAYISGFDFS